MAALFLNAALRKRIDRVAVLQRARWRMEAGLLSLFWWFSARLEPPTASAFGEREEISERRAALLAELVPAATPPP